ncbi:MAG: hypothetical protein NTZ25_01020 [Candidatus Peregrinibacteria bacterium]|nr:hypothetical protein [Candidatus Peregrinibacteria bacterium]
MDPKNTNPAANQGQKPAQAQPPKPMTPPPAQAGAQSVQGAQGQQGQQMPPVGYPPMPPQGMPPQGYPQPGAYPPGYPPMFDPYAQQQGYPPMGYYYPPQGQMPPQGMPPQGYPQPGAYPPGYPAPQGMPGFPPQGGQMPMGAGMPPQGAMPGQMPSYPPMPPAEDTTPANFQLGTKFPAKLNVTAPKSDLKFDDEYFIRLLAGSISLSKDEKKKIIESIPKLKQAQIDELVRIFEEEKQKFAALSKKHAPQLEKLAQQHFDEWMELEHEWSQSQKKTEDTSKADAIRKSLGL